MTKTMKLYRVALVPEDLAYKNYKEIHYTLDLHWAYQLQFDMMRNFRDTMRFKALNTPKFTTSIYEIEVEIKNEKEIYRNLDLQNKSMSWDEILRQDNRERY